MRFEYGFIFPVSILFATIAIGTGLIAEVFGFAGGIYAYANKKLVDYKWGLLFILSAALTTGRPYCDSGSDF